MTIINEYELHYVLDDEDEIVDSFNSNEKAYEEAHVLANANNRIYRVKRIKTIQRSKVTAIAVPIAKR